MNFYFIQCVMILFYHYFDAKIFLVADLTFHTGSFVFLMCPQSFCKNFPTFWDKKMFQAHLVFTLVQAWNQPCLQESFFFFFFWWKMTYRNQDMEAWHVHCYWSVIASKPLYIYTWTINLSLSSPTPTPSLAPFFSLSFFKTVSSYWYF